MQVFYADLGGIESVLLDIQELIHYPLQHPKVRSVLNASHLPSECIANAGAACAVHLNV